MPQIVVRLKCVEKIENDLLIMFEAGSYWLALLGLLQETYITVFFAMNNLVGYGQTLKISTRLRGRKCLQILSYWRPSAGEIIQQLFHNCSMIGQEQLS